ncbi:ATP-binding cassette domain-containing protein [Paenibacillus rhizoplanae]
MIALEGVSFGYDPEHPILHDINVSIPQGQWVSIVGPNGCGKSTLVKLLNALLPKSAGHISVCGHMLQEETVQSIRQCIGMVFFRTPITSLSDRRWKKIFSLAWRAYACPTKR